MEGGPHWQLVVFLANMQEEDAKKVQEGVEAFLRSIKVDPIETNLREMHLA